MSTTTLGDKHCVKCGRDVTSAKRMKDSKGKYWCHDCGNADEARKGTGLVSPCPKCQKPTHAMNLVRFKGQYVCESCGGGKNGEKAAVGNDDAKKQKQKLIIGAVTLVLGVCLIANSLFPELFAGIMGE